MIISEIFQIVVMWYEILPACAILIGVFKVHELAQQAHARQSYALFEWNCVVFEIFLPINNLLKQRVHRGMMDPRTTPDYQNDGGLGLDMQFQDMCERDRMMTVDPYRFKFMDKQWRPISEIKKTYDASKQS